MVGGGGEEKGDDGGRERKKKEGKTFFMSQPLQSKGPPEGSW